MLMRNYLGETSQQQIESLDKHLKNHKLHERELLLRQKNSPVNDRKIANIERYLQTGERRMDFPGIGEIRFGPYYKPASEKFFLITEKIVLVYVYVTLLLTTTEVVLHPFGLYCENDYGNAVYVTSLVLQNLVLLSSVGALFMMVSNAHACLSYHGLELVNNHGKRGCLALMCGGEYLSIEPNTDEYKYRSRILACSHLIKDDEEVILGDTVMERVDKPIFSRWEAFIFALKPGDLKKMTKKHVMK
ncbi:hypothetical protein HK096_005217 [Nowakowskiella sp. JEL0078]|nr:hypothetical protein HK096_005217 [Nowakowskiella sp. JEL0078]